MGPATIQKLRHNRQNTVNIWLANQGIQQINGGKNSTYNLLNYFNE
jgi:hypothetical protein